MKLPLYTIEGKEKGTVEVPDAIFGVSASSDLLHQAVNAALANLRKPYAHTKDRSEVRGGGRKPWKQKGTGRARHGSRRSPLWVGGGVTFGPSKEKVFAQKINTKMKQKALFGALSSKMMENNIFIVESFTTPEVKTKKGVAFLQAIKSVRGADKKLGKVLIWGSMDDKEFRRMFRNIAGVTPLRIENINIIDVFNHAHVIFSKSALDLFITRYGNTRLVQPKAGAAKEAV
ncbi:MAG: 50S ribosomal protein L4 [Candidatus Spechtbacteria bacterium]|nr:50S ribosomal protein L4 [Candidatus Spechtbacteria bacterium]